MEQAGTVTHPNATEPVQAGSDAECLAAYQRTRSETAFNAMVERHGAMVFRTCLRLLSNVQEAEDAAQAVFIVLATHTGSVRPTLALWLYDRARDSARVVLKSRLRRQRRENEAGTALRHQAMKRSDSNELREELDAAIARLPANLREALVLRYLEGHRVDNSARIAGCSERTFARYCEEGLERLRALLSKRGGATTSAAVLTLLTQEAAAKVSYSTLAALKTTFAGVSAAGTTGVAGATAHALTKTLFWAQIKAIVAVSTVAAAVALSTPLVIRALSPAPRAATVIPAARPVSIPTPGLSVSAEERKLVALQETICGRPEDFPWERVPWMVDLWAARRAAVEMHKPILLFDCWGHPLTASSSEGVIARRNFFSDPAILKMATNDFVPCVSDDWYLYRRADDEGEFFRLFGKKRNMVSSNIYCIAPDGHLLRAISLEGDADDARVELAAALKDYGQLPAASQSPQIAAPARVDAKFTRPVPPKTRVLRAFCRTLEKDQHGNLIPASRSVDTDFTGPGRDNMWIYENEWRALIKKDAHVGDTIAVPPYVLQRLCRFHLADYTRGEGVAYEDEGVLTASLTLTVEAVAGSKVKLHATGAATVATDRDIHRADCGFDPKFDGYVEYDSKTEWIERFDLVAVGEHWGEGYYNPGARPGRTPLGVAFQLVPESTEIRPADTVPPHGLRSIPDYLCAPEGDAPDF